MEDSILFVFLNCMLYKVHINRQRNNYSRIATLQTNFDVLLTFTKQIMTYGLTLVHFSEKIYVKEHLFIVTST